MNSRIFVALASSMAVLVIAPPAAATTSGANGPLVYAAQTPAGIQLFSIRPNGEQKRQLTHVDGDAVNPDWAPDGRSIVFEVGYEDHAAIAIMRRGGAGLREIASTGFQGQPAFTADGRHIVYERYLPETGDDSLWIMDRNGHNRHRLTRNPLPGQGWDTDPNISPDGKLISFVRVKQSEVLQALFTVHRDGSHLRRLTPYALDVGIKHDWAPTGLRIALIAHADPVDGQSANVATIRRNGTDLQMVTHYRGGEVNVLTGSYSPDGRWIAYRLEDHGTYTLSKVHPNGRHPQPIRRLVEAPRYIDWGTRIACH